MKEPMKPNGKAKKFIVKSINRKAGLVREHIVIVDEEDAYLMRNSFWVMACVNSGKAGFSREHVIRTTPHGKEFLSHVVVGAAPGERVYHINGNALDCRKSNLMRRSERVREIEVE